jgi:hypothetical protein
MALWLGLVAIPVVILYLLPLRLDRQTVATGMFWEQALAAEGGRARWQRWRHKVSLAAQLVLVAAATLAAAGLQIPRPQLVVLVLDNSASMNTQDVPPTRLAAAKELAGRLTEGLHADDRMAVLTAGGIATVVSGPSGDAAVLRAAIESIPATSEPPQMAGALYAAGTIPLPPGFLRRIVVLSDGCFADAAELAAQYSFEMIRFGTPVPNTAITRLAVRRTLPDPRVCEVLVETRNYSDRPADCRLGVEWGRGQPIDTVKLSMPPGGRWQQVFRMSTAAGGRLTARLDPPDAYPADNVATVDVPPTLTYRVTVEGNSEDSPLMRALRANPQVEIVDPQAPAKSQDGGASVSIRVFAGHAPEKLPPGLVLVVDPTGCNLLPAGPDGRLEVLACNPDDIDIAVQAALPIRVADALDRLAGGVPREACSPRPGHDASGKPLAADAYPRLAETPSNDGNRAGGIDLRKAADAGVDHSEITVRRPWPPAWLWPAGLALVILVVEWCLYQRRWMT